MAVEWDNGIPILTGESMLSDVPEYTQALAAASIMPVGAIMPYMGTADYWLFCNGRSYDATYFDVLSGISANFHGDGTFRVPDLRGRSPIGVGGGGIAREWNLGERWGDSVVGKHGHEIQMHSGDGTRVGRDTHNGGSFGVAVLPGEGVPTYPFYATWAMGAASDVDGMAANYHPSTGVNFIVYSGKPTLDTNGDILPECGQGEPITTVTTRMMIEARMAEKGIGEEELKMLKEQLATLKENHAK